MFFFYKCIFKVVVLLLKVRNAIQALQELATTSNTVARYPYPLPAHSNPNLPHSNPHLNNEGLLRSSSHPPEMFCWETEGEPEKLIDSQTQTDFPIDFIRDFVIENNQTVYEWLGLNPSNIVPEQHNVYHEHVSSCSNLTYKDDNRKCVSNHSISGNKPPDWLTMPLPPPSYWSSQHHRFSAGDVVERSSDTPYQTLNPLPSSRSLKFHPYS